LFLLVFELIQHCELGSHYFINKTQTLLTQFDYCIKVVNVVELVPNGAEMFDIIFVFEMRIE